MSQWIKRLSQRVAVLLYATLELLDLPRIQERPSRRAGNKQGSAS